MNDKDTKKKKLPMLPLDRRDFLRTVGIGGAATTVAACERLPARKALPYLVAPEDITPGVPVHYASTCTGCSAACGMMVTVRDGRPIKLEGHDKHPISGGGLCALGQAEIRGLYDAARLAGPTLAGAASTWEAFDAQIRSKLAAARSGGKSVEILAKPVTSPTARQTMLDFLAPFGGTLTEHDPTPLTRGVSQDAYEALDGNRVLPSLDFEAADLVVILGADLLGAGSDPVGDTRSYSARRANVKERGALRHIQIEGSLTLTGAAADTRWQASSGERNAIASWLLKSIAQRANDGSVLGALSGVPAEAPLGNRITQLADHLWEARGRSLVVSGSSNLNEQVAVALCNRLLRNEGKAVRLDRPSLAQQGSNTALAELQGRLASGKVGALIALDHDPVDQLADGAEWKKWLAAMDVSIAITDRPTATAGACKMVAAAHHGLETWQDFRPRADVLTLAQPTVRPILNSRHPIENFLVWGEGATRDYRQHLKESWQKTVFPKVSFAAGFEAFWHASVVAAMPPQAVTELPAPTGKAPKALGELLKPAASAAGLEVELTAQVGVRDGSRSYNPWLRELPEPLSQVSWYPTVAVAPSQAAKLGVKTGDQLQITVGKRSLKMAARVTLLQHPDVLGVPVGYGRNDQPTGYGHKHHDDALAYAPEQNAYALGAGPATAKSTGVHVELPLTQEYDSNKGEFDKHGRPIIHQVATHDEKIKSHLPQYLKEDPRGVHRETADDHLGGKHEYGGAKWHMSINLDACTGCSSCIIGCQAENNVPTVGPLEVTRNRDLHWLRMDRYFVAEEDEHGHVIEGGETDVLFEPMLCQHCDSAPCETVCPAAATLHSHDGLNMQAYNRCVGTRYCANNCPYKVRRFNWFQYEHGEPLERMVLNPDVVVRERGVMEKCSFCVQRIQLARIEARKRGDKNIPEVKTACQQSCPADAIHFGNANDPKSVVSQDRKDPRAFRVLAELEVGPSITYLARVRSRQS